MYHDPMYGSLVVPPLIEELAHTPEVQRLKLISQDVLPQSCLPYAVPSRFEHSMGVWHLSQRALRQNTLERKDAMLLSVAALLHDAGNPPLSHLSEPFLAMLTGKDGESFLEERLQGSAAAALLAKAGVNVHDVVRCVTGNMKPLSLLVNGSLDVDNLDNVGRYWFTGNHGEILFDAEAIASCFRYHEGSWALQRQCFREARKWQAARAKVYGTIYGQPHLNIAMMIYRAVEIAYFHGDIQEDFFHLDDCQALDFLSGCNEDTAYLVCRVLEKRWYLEIVSSETTTPSDELKVAAKDRTRRKMVANTIADRCNMPLGSVCVYVGEGRDKRKIDLPFIDQRGMVKFDTAAHLSVYRVRVYIDPQFADKEKDITLIVREMIE